MRGFGFRLSPFKVAPVVPPVLLTSSCECSVIVTLWSDKTEAGRQDCKHIFSTRPAHKARLLFLPLKRSYVREISETFVQHRNSLGPGSAVGGKWGLPENEENLKGLSFRWTPDLLRGLETIVRTAKLREFSSSSKRNTTSVSRKGEQVQ